MNAFMWNFDEKRRDMIMRCHSLYENTWFYFIIPFHEPGIDILMAPFSVNFPWHDFIIFHNWRKRLKFKNVITNYCHNIFFNEQKLIIIDNVRVYCSRYKDSHGHIPPHVGQNVSTIMFTFPRGFLKSIIDWEELTSKNLIQRVLQ